MSRRHGRMARIIGRMTAPAVRSGHRRAGSDRLGGSELLHSIRQSHTAKIT
jgi:hypothetical protein